MCSPATETIGKKLAPPVMFYLCWQSLSSGVACVCHFLQHRDKAQCLFHPQYPKYTLTLTTSFKILCQKGAAGGNSPSWDACSLSALSLGSGPSPRELSSTTWLGGLPTFVGNKSFFDHTKRIASWILAWEFNLGRELPQVTVRIQW